MPTKMFFDLSKEKRNKIIEVCITEFAQYGYTNSSTNRIIQNAGISKGSLFKYFQNKEELYFYILDTVMMELTTDLGKNIETLPLDLFERIIKYSELEFVWYIKYPDKCRIITTAFSKNDAELHQKVEKRYKVQGKNIYYRILENIDTSTLKWDEKKTVNILKWFLLGFKEDFIADIKSASAYDIDTLQCEYIKGLKEYIRILKSGLATMKLEE